jgi:hypothetical protein
MINPRTPLSPNSLADIGSLAEIGIAFLRSDSAARRILWEITQKWSGIEGRRVNPADIAVAAAVNHIDPAA